jgi:hypothetical protein
MIMTERQSRLSRLVSGLIHLAVYVVFLSVPAWLVLANFSTVEPLLYPLHLAQDDLHAQGAQMFGPYPDEATLAGLRERGYTTVISLLDPDLIYEASLLEKERAAAARLGLEFINLPMVSGVPADAPKNAKALTELTSIFKATPGLPAYIHCYLGKHRAKRAREWLGKDAPQGGPLTAQPAKAP